MALLWFSLLERFWVFSRQWCCFYLGCLVINQNFIHSHKTLQKRFSLIGLIYDMVWYLIWYDIWYEMMRYDMIYDMKLYRIWYICWLQLGWHPVAVVQYTFTHKQYTEQQIKQNTQSSTYITVTIHKHNNTKYIIYKIKQKHTKHTTTAHSPKVSRSFCNLTQLHDRERHTSKDLVIVWEFLWHPVCTDFSVIQLVMDNAIALPSILSSSPATPF